MSLTINQLKRAFLDDSMPLEQLTNYVHAKWLPAEAEIIIASIISSRTRVQTVENKRKSQSDRLLNLIQRRGIVLFRDQYNIAHVRYPQIMSGVKVIRTLASPDFRDWLAGVLLKDENSTAEDKVLKSALNTLKSMASESPQYTLWSRYAPDGEGGIWIDIGDESWRAIHVTKDGWSLVAETPILFKRFSMKPLPEPVSGGNVKDILKFANLKNENDKILYIVSAVTACIPNIPHPVLILFGEPGSGKTSIQVALRTIIDPRETKPIGIPKDEKELNQQLYHGYYCIYDNLSEMPKWASDLFCRVVYGGGSQKRKLFTDDDDISYNMMRPISINSLTQIVSHNDLLDRAILIEVERIAKIMSDEKFNSLLNSEAPAIFGAILDLLVKAMNIYPRIELAETYRLQDFVQWGAAILYAMGDDPQKFLDAYDKNVKVQSSESVEQSLVASTMIDFFEEFKVRSFVDAWTGSPSKLLSDLNSYAANIRMNTNQSGWPKNSTWLSRNLQRISRELLSVGYKLTFEHSGKRLITINKTSEFIPEKPQKMTLVERLRENSSIEQLILQPQIEQSDIQTTKVDSKFKETTEIYVKPVILLDEARRKASELAEQYFGKIKERDMRIFLSELNAEDTDTIVEELIADNKVIRTRKHSHLQ
jgi:hypothetical protein